jgi:hypothetical protein
MTSVSLLLCALVALRLRVNLKKQSQFVPNEIGAKPYVTAYYDNMPVNGAEENKANRTCPEHVERSQFIFQRGERQDDGVKENSYK